MVCKYLFFFFELTGNDLAGSEGPLLRLFLKCVYVTIKKKNCIFIIKKKLSNVFFKIFFKTFLGFHLFSNEAMLTKYLKKNFSFWGNFSSFFYIMDKNLNSQMSLKFLLHCSAPLFERLTPTNHVPSELEHTQLAGCRVPERFVWFVPPFHFTTLLHVPTCHSSTTVSLPLALPSSGKSVDLEMISFIFLPQKCWDNFSWRFFTGSTVSEADSQKCYCVIVLATRTSPVYLATLQPEQDFFFFFWIVTWISLFKLSLNLSLIKKEN